MDGGHALWYLAEGDVRNAGLTALGMIGGDAAKLGKYAVKATAAAIGGTAVAVKASKMARAAKSASKIVVNSWQGAESAMAKVVGGISQHKVQTRLGERILDQFAKGVGYEVKYGYQSLSKQVATQVAKDAELIASKQVKSIEWHFWKNEKGIGGPNGPLRQALNDAGIKIVIHN